ncbi:MAG: hypothetical protein R3B69_02235 [Candidatus Paceibacterota bacterium]
MDIISLVALAIFSITFFFILTERIHRTVVGLFWRHEYGAGGDVF